MALKASSKLRALLINDDTRTMVRKQIALARKNVLDLETVAAMAVDLPAGGVSDFAGRNMRPPRIHQPIAITIPIGYECAVSYEMQPPGLCIHLSISVERGYLIHPTAFEAIAKLYGVVPPFETYWLEEFEPGHHAVNAVALVPPEKAQQN